MTNETPAEITLEQIRARDADCERTHLAPRHQCRATIDRRTLLRLLDEASRDQGRLKEALIAVIAANERWGLTTRRRKAIEQANSAIATMNEGKAK